jgi:hypothetical protein
MSTSSEENFSFAGQTAEQQADTDVESKDSQETADCKQWHKRLKDAKEFDREAHRAYARDRSYLSGSKAKFKVIVPIAQTYVDILESFLYTRNPTVEVDPTAMSEPPPQKQVLAKAVEQVLAKRQQQFQGMQKSAQIGKMMAQVLPPQVMMEMKARGDQAIQQKAQQTGQPPPPSPPPGIDITQMQPPQNVPDTDPEVQQTVDEVMTPYRKMRDDASQFADTLEILVQKSWETADLKRRGKKCVNSAISIGIGWIKAGWYERKGEDPTTQRQLNDLLEQAAELEANRQIIAKGDKTEEQLDARRAELQQQIAGIQAMDDVVLERGFLIENVPAQDIQVSTEVASIADYKDAAWITHYTYPTLERARADYPDIANKLDKANKYYAVKPKARRTTTNLTSEAQFPEDKEIRSEDAQFFRMSDSTGNRQVQSSDPCIQVKEIWDRVTGNIITLIDGLNMYAKPPYVPEVKSTRGFPFFQYAIGIVDGERHPVSYISRSDTLIEEYNDTRTKFRTVRRRSIPKTVYQRSQLPADEAQKLARADTGEMVGIDTTNPDQPLNQVMAQVVYAGVDPALYDTSTIVSELERVWGIAEALQAATQPGQPMTAAQSEIQSSGTQNRLGKRTDDLDDMLSDLAQYTAEQLLQVIQEEDAVEMAGPWAFWPTGLSIQDMQVMTSVKVSAGSSGRPATAMQQQAWAAILPQLKASIEQIGALRKSSPDEIADCLEQLVIETTRRTGDRIDPTRFLPDPPRQPPPQPPPKMPPLQDSALNGAQAQAMLQILLDCRGKAIAAPAATAILHACFPQVPQAIVEAMVKGALPLPGDPPTEIKSKNVQTRSPESKNPSEANPNPPPMPTPPPGANGATPPLPPGATP